MRLSASPRLRAKRLCVICKYLGEEFLASRYYPGWNLAACEYHHYGENLWEDKNMDRWVLRLELDRLYLEDVTFFEKHAKEKK